MKTTLLAVFAVLVLIGCSSEDRFELQQPGVTVKATRVAPEAMPASDAKAVTRLILQRKK